MTYDQARNLLLNCSFSDYSGIMRLPLLLVSLLLASSSASALVINTVTLDEPVGNPAVYDQISVVTVETGDEGAQFQSNWLLDAATFGGTVDLAATALWTIEAFTANALVLSVDISNDTIAPTNDPDFNAAILSFGFGTNPDTNASLIDAGSTFDVVGEGSGKKQNFPGGFKGIDVCIFAQGCSGGSINDGLNIGESDFLTISLTPDVGSFGSSVDLSIFAVKFQGTQGSYEFVSAPNHTTPVPGPAAATLFCLGVVTFLLGIGRRRGAGIAG